MPSNLERKFTLFWNGLKGPELKAEVKVIPTRRWRFDFVHDATRTIFEIEGGVWSGGRHTRGAGFTADCEKYNEATLGGWTVFRLTGSMITTPTIERLIRYVREKSAANRTNGGQI